MGGWVSLPLGCILDAVLPERCRGGDVGLFLSLEGLNWTYGHVRETVV
jgi:hypothetical protein